MNPTTIDLATAALIAAPTLTLLLLAFAYTIYRRRNEDYIDPYTGDSNSGGTPN